MRRFRLASLGAAILLVFGAGTALADFTPIYKFSLSDKKVNANPQLTFHLEFDRDDEEIGLFTGTLPRGFKIAADAAIPDGEQIGAGQITIAGGIGCRPGSPTPDARVPATINATFYEKDRTDEETDSGVYSVWFLDLEPLNRVRLLVTGSPSTGWSVSGAPTPSDNTCNPLTADLNIYPKSEGGVPVVVNPPRARKKKFTATISSQDSPAIATFIQYITIVS